MREFLLGGTNENKIINFCYLYYIRNKKAKCLLFPSYFESVLVNSRSA